MANGHCCLHSQHGVPLEEPSVGLLAGVRASHLNVARLERGDDGHGSGAQGGREQSRPLVQTGAGHLGPPLSGRQVTERGPAEECAHSFVGGIIPLDRRENRNGRLRTRGAECHFIVTFHELNIPFLRGCFRQHAWGPF